MDMHFFISLMQPDCERLDFSIFEDERGGVWKNDERENANDLRKQWWQKEMSFGTNWETAWKDKTWTSALKSYLKIKW